MKPFMVDQLAAAFEHDRIILSPYDEILHKQLIDYTVEKISSNGIPIYTSVNEHFVDALGLAYLAFVLEFPNLTQAIREVKNSSLILHADNVVGSGNQAKIDLTNIEQAHVKNPWKNVKVNSDINDPRELKGDKQQWVKVPSGPKTLRTASWGSRGSRGSGANYRRSW